MLHMAFFFGLVLVMFANSYPGGNQGILNKGRVGDPIPVVDGAAKSHVVHHIDLSI